MELDVSGRGEYDNGNCSYVKLCVVDCLYRDLVNCVGCKSGGVQVE